MLCISYNSIYSIYYTVAVQDNTITYEYYFLRKKDK